MKTAFFIFAYMAVISTALPFIPSTAWWVRVFEFPRYQIILLGLLALVFLLIDRDFTTHVITGTVLVGAVIIYQAVKIYPYTFLSGKQVVQAEKWKDENCISLVMANVLMDNKNIDKFLEIVRRNDPDVILAVETNKHWVDKMNVLLKDYPHKVLIPLENTYGMALYSRLELKGQQTKCLVENDIPSIHTFIELPSGKEVEAHFLHPRPPAPQESKDSKERDAELLIVGKEVKDSQNPVIVAGDLNDVAWSETTTLFQKISRLLDPRIGRGFYNTFHADYFFLRWPLDYVFHSHHFKLVKLERLPYFNSDHFPVYVKLSFDPQAPMEHERPKANHEEKAEANEKIEKGKSGN